MKKYQKKFRLRNFISLSMFLFFTFLMLSGIVLYIRPEGSVAQWVGWELIGMDKKSWEVLHTTIAFLFIPLVGFHLYFNWKVLLHYLKKKSRLAIRSKTELTASLSILGFVFLSIIFQWKPLWKIGDWRSDIKKGESIYKVPEPQPDFSKKNLNEVASFLETPTSILMEQLSNLGYKTKNPDEELRKLAARNKTSPEKIFIQLIEK